jgi:hypothetical protein
VRKTTLKRERRPAVGNEEESMLMRKLRAGGIQGVGKRIEQKA